MARERHVPEVAAFGPEHLHERSTGRVRGDIERRMSVARYSSCWPSPIIVAGLAVDGESGDGTGGAHRRRRGGEAGYGHGQRDNERRDDPRSWRHASKSDLLSQGRDDPGKGGTRLGARRYIGCVAVRRGTRYSRRSNRHVRGAELSRAGQASASASAPSSGWGAAVRSMTWLASTRVGRPSRSFQRVSMRMSSVSPVRCRTAT